MVSTSLLSRGRGVVLKALTAAPRPTTMAKTMAPAVTVPALGGARAFSGNVEYPRIEGSVLEVTKNLTTIGARLSIPTAALYLTRQKVEYIVRGLKTPDECREVQRVLLLCDAKFVYPTEFAISSFLSACLRLGAPEVALAFVREAKHMRHYVKNQSFVRLATHYSEQGDDATVDELVAIMARAGIPASPKMVNFRVARAKAQGRLDEAIALAKAAAEDRQINAHTVLTILGGLEGEALEAQFPVAKYLIDKGEVMVNAKLDAVLKGN